MPEVPGIGRACWDLPGAYHGALRARGDVAEEGAGQKTPKRPAHKGPWEMLTHKQRARCSHYFKARGILFTFNWS